jgi:hypothetical protein
MRQAALAGQTAKIFFRIKTFVAKTLDLWGGFGDSEGVLVTSTLFQAPAPGRFFF